LVAIYDHSVWWSWPEDELTYGLFDESRFAEFPDDRSLRLVHGSQVSRFEGEPMGERRRYRDVLRDRAMTLETAPLDGRFYVITGHDTYHLEENGFGDYAWDLVRTGADGLTYRGAGTSNEDYFVWGAPVRLPAAGVVTEIRDSAPDNVPGILAPVSEEPDCGENNCLGVHLGGGFYLYLLHLRQGSVPDAIQLGDTLSAGTLIGEVGNSGVSLAPHLHVALLWYDAAASTPRSWSVPVEMENIWWSSESSGATQAEYLNPTAGTWLSAEEF
jgi:hypothetical protein